MGPEAKIEQKFCKEVKKYGAIPFKFVSPGYSGVTDRLVLLPGGQVVFVEIKQPRGVKSALQISFGRLLESKQANYEVIWCDEDIYKFVDKYLWYLK